jgi:hypothetical protein
MPDILVQYTIQLQTFHVNIHNNMADEIMKMAFGNFVI